MSNKKTSVKGKVFKIERTSLKYIIFSSLLNACFDDNIKKQVNLLFSQVNNHICVILCHSFNMDPFSSVKIITILKDEIYKKYKCIVYVLPKRFVD